MLHRLIGLYCVIFCGCFTFGMSVTKVLLMSSGIFRVVKALIQLSMTAEPVSIQYFWKKTGWIPSDPGPGAFSGLKDWIAFLISEINGGFVRLSLSCCGKMLRRLGLIVAALGQEVNSIVYVLLKCPKIISWISCGSKVQFPTESLRPSILFFLLGWIVELWKNLVSASPSFSHWTLDFSFWKSCPFCKMGLYSWIRFSF